MPAIHKVNKFAPNGEACHFSHDLITCRFAGRPTSLCPSSVNATIEGVVLPPSAFSITRGSVPSMIATHELVVPKSIPITSLDLQHKGEEEKNEEEKK